MDTQILATLTQVLKQRRGADPDTSYVASLYAKGLNKILQKVGEEATEVILAAKDLAAEHNDANTKALTGEVADLWFHSLVMLVHQGVDPEAILQELDQRFGLSGLEEKAQRKS